MSKNKGKAPVAYRFYNGAEAAASSVPTGKDGETEPGVEIRFRYIVIREDGTLENEVTQSMLLNREAGQQLSQQLLSMFEALKQWVPGSGAPQVETPGLVATEKPPGATH